MQKAGLEPRAITVLVVDNNPSSRASTLRLLQECSYNVRRAWGPGGAVAVRAALPSLLWTVCRTYWARSLLQAVAAQRGSEALRLLEERAAATGSPGVHVVLKDHDPPASNAVRFLHRLREHPSLRGLPVIGA